MIFEYCIVKDATSSTIQDSYSLALRGWSSTQAELVGCYSFNDTTLVPWDKTPCMYHTEITLFAG